MYLESAPNRSIKKFRMICCCNDYDVTGECVYLQQQGADDSLYFSRIMYIAAFFSKSVEFVKEQDASARWRTQILVSNERPSHPSTFRLPLRSGRREKSP